MLHVLFILLKILGILLLLLFGLVLLVLLVVLLVPVRYSFELKKKEEDSPKFAVKITWLFRLFYFKTSYIDNLFDYRVRILGYQIAGNQKEFLEGQKKRQERKEEKERKREERKKGKEAEKSKKKETGNPETELAVKSVSEDSVSREKPEEDIFVKAGASKEQRENQTENPGQTAQKDSGKQQKKPEEQSAAKKESFFKKSKERVKSLKETKTALDQLPWREWLELGRNILIRFLKHVLPRKLKGSITFGLSDPADTGYITGIAAMFYSKYGDHFSLYPDFEKKVFDAECAGRGRIRLGYMLVLAVSVLKEESVRTIIKNIILG